MVFFRFQTFLYEKTKKCPFTEEKTVTDVTTNGEVKERNIITHLEMRLLATEQKKRAGIQARELLMPTGI